LGEEELVRLHIPWIFATLVLLSPFSPGQGEASYAAGTLQQIQKQVVETPSLYLWNTVVTRTQIVSYRLQVQSGNEVFVGEFTPVIQPSDAPIEWTPGSKVRVRFAKGKMYVKTSYGEVTTQVVGHRSM
jgi:hypothetical protein